MEYYKIIYSYITSHFPHFLSTAGLESAWACYTLEVKKIVTSIPWQALVHELGTSTQLLSKWFTANSTTGWSWRTTVCLINEGVLKWHRWWDLNHDYGWLDCANNRNWLKKLTWRRKTITVPLHLDRIINAKNDYVYGALFDLKTTIYQMFVRLVITQAFGNPLVHRRSHLIHLAPPRDLWSPWLHRSNPSRDWGSSRDFSHLERSGRSGGVYRSPSQNHWQTIGCMYTCWGALRLTTWRIKKAAQTGQGRERRRGVMLHGKSQKLAL